MRMRLRWSMLTGYVVTIGLCRTAVSDEISIVPRPKHAQLGTARVTFPSETVIAIGENATPMEQYAADVIARDLRIRYQRKAQIVRPNENNANQASVILGQGTANPELWQSAAKIVGARLPTKPGASAPEGYRLWLQSTGRHPVVCVMGSDPSGALYGAFALLQLFEQSGDRLTLPSPLEIVDAPALETRAYTGSPRDVSERSLETLDWLARWRLNACYYEIYGDQGQSDVPSVIADLAKECDRRGITLYGCASNWRTELFLKRQLCPSKAEDVQLVERLFTRLADRGCRGLIFLFDDLTQESVCHTETCADCRRAFGDLAGTQIFWVRKMAEVARQKGITRVLFCPTPYYRGWQKSYSGKLDGLAYYRKFAEASDLADAQMYHCPFATKEVAAVEKAGLRNYVWWQNGVYSLPSLSESVNALGLWGGLPQVSWGWYGAEWKADTGPVTSPEILADLRSLASRTKHAWLCAGGDMTFAVWGTYTWNPRQYDPERTERDLVEALFGDGSFKPYASIERETRRWAYRLAGKVAPALGIADNDPAKVLADLETSVGESRRQLASLKLKTTEQTVRPPLLAREQAQSYINQIEGDIALLDRKLEQGKTGRTTVAAPPLAREAEGQGFKYESKMTLSNFFTSFLLRYALHEEPAGVFRRCQWHFGSGLGKMAPSYRNWYDAGFIDVEVDGKSLDTCKASFKSVKDDQGSEQLVGRWEGTQATVILCFGLSKSGALMITGQVDPKADVQSLRVVLWCIPGAGWGEWKDMDKWLTTATRSVQHSQSVKLDPVHEDWGVYYDRTYDIPHEKAEGPCAFMFVPSEVTSVDVDLQSYVVATSLVYPKECRQFRLAVWDLHGAKNADALRYFNRNAERLRGELRSSSSIH